MTAFLQTLVPVLAVACTSAAFAGYRIDLPKISVKREKNLHTGRAFRPGDKLTFGGSETLVGQWNPETKMIVVPFGSSCHPSLPTREGTVLECSGQVSVNELERAKIHLKPQSLESIMNRAKGTPEKANFEPAAPRLRKLTAGVLKTRIYLHRI